MIDLRQDGLECVKMIKDASFFPFRTGFLRNHATSGRMVSNDTFLIKFDGNIAPYVEYLEEGTTAHDIPGAFGKPLPFGIGGRFRDKFHPGSTKHYKFIQNKTINAILMYFVLKYNGEVKL